MSHAARLALSVSCLTLRELEEFRAELVRLLGGNDPLAGVFAEIPPGPRGDIDAVVPEVEPF